MRVLVNMCVCVCVGGGGIGWRAWWDLLGNVDERDKAGA